MVTRPTSTPTQKPTTTHRPPTRHGARLGLRRRDSEPFDGDETGRSATATDKRLVVIETPSGAPTYSR